MTGLRKSMVISGKNSIFVPVKNFLKILRYAGPYWVYASLNVVFNIFAVLFSLVSFGLFIPVLQMLFHQMEIPQAAPPLKWSDFNSLKDNFYYQSGHLLQVYGYERVLI